MRPDHFRGPCDLIPLNSCSPIIGRFANRGLVFLSSTWGLPVALSIGDFSHTTLPQSAAPQRLTATFASPAWVSQMPEGSSARDAPALDVTLRKTAAKTARRFMSFPNHHFCLDWAR